MLWCQYRSFSLIQLNYLQAFSCVWYACILFLPSRCTLKGEEDYRHVFDNFVNDLLLTVSKPEWPAAEVLLSLLGSLLVQQFSNKAVDQSLRVASLDYLGTVASRLRRDAVNSQLSEKDIDEIIRDLTSETSNGWNVDDGGDEDAEEKERAAKAEAEEEENEEEDSDKEGACQRPELIEP